MPLEFQTALHPASSEFKFKKLPLSLGIQDAARGMVWIFSGITHYERFSLANLLAHITYKAESYLKY